jgi:two-component sensor histidine kinase
LIVNELVTNAIKYAFPDQTGGTVIVSLRKGASIEVTVQDDGVGCPGGKPDGMGTRLIQLLAGQIGATFQRKNANPGCCVRLVVPDRQNGHV